MAVRRRATLSQGAFVESTSTAKKHEGADTLSVRLVLSHGTSP
jgi:hypothetical protein